MTKWLTEEEQQMWRLWIEALKGILEKLVGPVRACA